MSDLVIRISGDVKSYKDSLDEVQSKTSDLDSALSTSAKVAGIAFAALSTEIGFSIKAYGQQEAASKSLTLAMQNAGIYSKQLFNNYRDQASALQALTGIDDDEIAMAQAQVQARIGQTVITKELTKAMLDLSVGQKMSLEAAGELISKGIDGQTMALKKAGIEIRENLTQQERMAEIIAKVNVKYGDQAEAANKGVGSLKGLKAAFGEVQEEIGKNFGEKFEMATKFLTGFLTETSRNEELLRFAAAITAGGAALSGFITVLSLASKALIAAQAYAAAYGVTLTAALGPIGLVAIAITGLAAAFGYMAINSQKAGIDTRGLNYEIEATQKRIRDLEPMSVWDERKSKQLDEAKAKLKGLQDQLARVNQTALTDSKRAEDQGQDRQKRIEAEKVEAIRKEYQEREQAANRAHLQQLKMQASDASQEMIQLVTQEAGLLAALADRKNESIKAQLQTKLDLVRSNIAEQHDLEINQAAIFQSQILMQTEEFNQLTLAQQESFMANKAMAVQSQIQTESSTRALSAQTALQEQVKAHNELLKDQQKYGTAYAYINQFMHSEVFKGTASAMDSMATMSRSKNTTLKEIGKAAAIANIGIKTAEGAMNIYAGFSLIPIIGPALGIAAAAAFIAFGAEQMGDVMAMASGGLVTGGTPGRDSVPILGMPGELMVPTQNFDEVVNAVAAARTGGSYSSGDGDGSAGGGGIARVVLELRDGLMDFIEAKTIERQSLGISLVRG